MSAYDPNRAPLPAHILARMSRADRARYGSPPPPAAAPRAAVPLPDRREASLSDHQEEQRIQGEILGWLRSNGYEPGYSRMDKKSNLPLGWPDIFLAAKNGRAVAVEVKTPAGKTSDDQDERIFSMRRSGWAVEVVRSLADVQAFLNHIESGDY